MFPGYKHVEAFGPDAGYEEGVEVEYVTLDLGQDVATELIPHATEYRLVGLDTSAPLLQVSKTIFRGTHERLVGTELLFTDGRDESDPTRKFIVPVGTTERRIKFEEMEVKAKTGGGEGGGEGGSGEGGGGGGGEKETEQRKGKASEKLAYGETIVDLSSR